MSTALTTIADRAALSPADYFAARNETNRFLDLAKLADRSLVQAKVAAMLQLEQLVASGATRQKAVKAIAPLFRGRGRGFSAATLTKDFQLWSKGGQKQDAHGRRSGQYFPARDWRMFVPGYTNGDQQAALSNEPFIEQVRQMDADSVRADVRGASIRDRLLTDWFADKEIKGYGRLSQYCAERGLPMPGPYDAHRNLPAFIPAGWSEDNLNRIIRRFEPVRPYIRQGEHAAHSHWGLQLLRDRSKLMPLQMITFDDVHFDIAVIWDVPGQKPQVVRPKAIFAMDVATGCILSYGVMGSYTRTSDGDGGKAGVRRGLQQADMRFLVCSLLQTFGMPRDWQMAYLTENASASMGAVDEAIFCELTGARIDHTNLVRNKLFTSDFVEQGGCPWQKGWIESWFKLFHMRTNHLLGAFGQRYDIKRGNQLKAASYAIDIACKALDKGIPLDQVKLPLLTLSQFEELVGEYVTRLNLRTNHSLQGFEKAYEIEATPGVYYRTDDPRALPYITEGAPLHARMESPAERLMRLARGHHFDPVNPRIIATLSLDKHIITIKGDKVRLKVTRLSNDPLEFFAEASIPALRKYRGIEKGALAFVSTDGSLCHLFTNDADMTFIATLYCNERVDMTDRHAILARAGEVHQHRQGVRDSVAELLGPRNEYYTAMRAQHEELGLVTHPVADRIAKETTRAERKKAERKSYERIEHDYFAYAAIEQPEPQLTEDDDDDEGDSGLCADIFLNP